MGTSRLSGRRNPSATASSPGPYALTRAIGRLYLDDSGGTFSVQLPDPAANVGQEWELVRTGGTQNAVTLVRFAAEQIQGAAQDRILRAPYGTWILSCDGTNWRLAGQNRLDLIYTSSDVLTVEAGWRNAEAYLRAGAGGGAGGGGGGGGNGAGGGGGGKGGGGGGCAIGIRRMLILPAAGTVLTLTVGAGGTGGAGGPGGPANTAGTLGSSGGSGSATEILNGATRLLRHARNASATGGGAGSGGGAGGTAAGGGAAGTTGGAGAPATSCVPSGWGATGGAGANGGAGGGAGVAGTAGTASAAVASTNGPWSGAAQSSSAGGNGGAQSGGTHGGGGGGGAGGMAVFGDDFSADGVEADSDSGRGGNRVATEGDGGAGNSAGTGVAGNTGRVGYAGTNGRGGGGGQGGGGGGGGSVAGGAGGTGGAGAAGSNGLIVITVWE